VLSAGALDRSREVSILAARVHLLAARVSLEVARLLPSRPLVNAALEAALHSLRSARSDLANPSMLPTTFPQLAGCPPDNAYGCGFHEKAGRVKH
jgi:hypothetical protein